VAPELREAAGEGVALLLPAAGEEDTAGLEVWLSEGLTVGVAVALELGLSVGEVVGEAAGEEDTLALELTVGQAEAVEVREVVPEAVVLPPPPAPAGVLLPLGVEVPLAEREREAEAVPVGEAVPLGHTLELCDSVPLTVEHTVREGDTEARGLGEKL